MFTNSIVILWRAKGILYTYSDTETDQIWPNICTLLSTRIPTIQSDARCASTPWGNPLTFLYPREQRGLISEELLIDHVDFQRFHANHFYDGSVFVRGIVIFFIVLSLIISLAEKMSYISRTFCLLFCLLLVPRFQFKVHRFHIDVIKSHMNNKWRVDACDFVWLNETG